MKLKDARGIYDYNSGKASDLARQMALAGIAIVWIFRIGQDTGIKIPADLVVPLWCLVLSLTLDLAQYWLATAIWSGFHRSKEKRGVKEDEDFLAPPWINWPSLMLFYLKLIFLAAAYLLILKYLTSNILST